MTRLLTLSQLTEAAEYNKEQIDRFTPTDLAILSASWQSKYGLEVDGKYGLLTRSSMNEVMHVTKSQQWDGGPIERIPRTRREVYQVFGHPGTSSVDRKWKRQNIVKAKNLPGTWNGNGRWCHRLAEPYAREALRRCEEAGVLPYVERFGCFVFRHQRHDFSRPLSYHSWGVSWDVNPEDNKARQLVEYHLPWSDEWKKIWPNGVPRALVEAFESVGFTWGGRWRDFTDPMHFQLCG